MAMFRVYLFIAVAAMVITSGFAQRTRTRPTRPTTTAIPNSCQIQRDPNDNERYGFCDDTLDMSDTVSRKLEAMRESLEDLDEQKSSTKEVPAVEANYARHQAIVPIASSVSWCRERCFTYRPNSVYINGIIWFVVQNDWLRQYITTCRCLNRYCSGSATYNRPAFSWRGVCVKERSWVKLLVYNRFQCVWRWVKVDRGCCCVPYRYAAITGPNVVTRG